MSVACFSIPNIPLVEIDPELVQQLAILLLKSTSAMVLLLRVNVSQHGLKLTWAYRKRAVAALVESCSIAESGQRRRAYARIPLQTERVLDASPFPKGRGLR